MSEGQKISVIVPMYNAEKYLPICINSVLGQTFQEFELILVDDCSTDGTLKIAKSFNDSRIKILRTESNLNFSGSTRNVGLEKVLSEKKSKYIYFMDNDDVIAPNTLEVLFHTAEENSSDVVYSTQWLIPKNPEFANIIGLECIPRATASASPVSEDLKIRLWEELGQHKMHVPPWLFLYKREFLAENKIKFPAQVAEDVFFTLDVLFATSKITKINFPFYFWRVYSSSTSHTTKRIALNTESIITLAKYIEKKLEPTGDEEFIRAMIFSVLNDVVQSYLLESFQRESTQTLREMEKTLQEKFGENSLFVRAIFQGYLMGLNTMFENQKLKARLETFNTRIV